MSYCLNPFCPKPHKNPEGINFCLSCGTNVLLDNRYRAVRLLGGGGMGRNLLAVDERTPTKKSCVIKQFFPIPQIIQNPAAYAKALELFNREATTLDELGDESHHIPRLLAYIEQDQRLYFVQEFIDGQNLLDELENQGTYSEAQIYELLKDLLPILQFIHQRDVVHRDIKPDNIMRRRDGKLVLIDFGISKELRGTVLSMGTQAGTLGYAPPEQMTYGVAYPASDIYALGSTCIHLLTNIAPDQLYNFPEQRWIWSDILASQGVILSQYLPQILDKMLVVDLGQRYQSVDEILNDLQQIFAPTVINSASPTANKSLVIVDPSGTADYTNISDAIKQSSAGTIILVRPGLYQEGLVIDKPLEIIGDGLVAEIIIQCTDSSCILMQTDHALLRGLTLKGCAGKNGKKYFAVDIPQGQLKLENCDITSDSLSCVAIHGLTANPIIRHCKIHDGKQGGVFVYENGQGTVENCNIFGNVYAGVAISQGANPVIRHCQIHDGQRGGVYVTENGQGTVENCDIFGNALSEVVIKQSGNPVIRQCLIHDSKQNGVYVTENGQGTVENCDIFGNALSGVVIKQGGKSKIQGCRINRNKSLGVYVHSQGGGSIENCDLTGNSQGSWNIEPFSVRRSGNKV